MNTQPKREVKTDWWGEIDSKERAEIEEGLVQACRGEVIPHEEVMSKYQKWRKK